MTLTHYEILGLKENCSEAEIRASFVILAKKYHPDTNSTNAALHEKFVKINEAYSILSKKHLRRLYDHNMRSGFATNDTYKYGRNSTHEEHVNATRWRDDTIRQRYKQYGTKYTGDNYYGIKGFPRKSNSFVAAGACVLIVVGAILQAAMIRAQHATHFQHRWNRNSWSIR